MEDRYTGLESYKKECIGLELANKLFNNGCDVESDCSWNIRSKKTNNNQTYFKIPAYNIIIEICSRNAIRFFGSGKIKDDKGRLIHIFNYHSLAVYNLFEQNKKQEAEDYIWDHCLFNPKNKESK